jgi:molybdenum cofactor guanylyltransferase
MILLQEADPTLRAGVNRRFQSVIPAWAEIYRGDGAPASALGQRECQRVMGMTAFIERVAGVVLAGGLSRRMGGGDKALRDLAGKPLIQRVIERLSAQASPVAINANGDASRFAGFGLPVIADASDDFPGPLAGILAGLRWAAHAAPDARFIVTAACDTPFFPEDLVAKFLAAAGSTYPAIVLAKSGEQVQPVFGLWPLALADDLATALASGSRKVRQWAQQHPHFIAEFPMTGPGGEPGDPFFNANTPEQLADAAALARDAAESPSR